MMFSHTIFCISIVVLFTPSVIQCISVIGPRVLRPFNSYNVSIHGGSHAYTLYVAIEGTRANGEQFSQGREVAIQAASSRLIGLDIDDPGPGRYSLVARSTSGPQFSSSAPLVYQPRSFCVFVQTDKRVYQPGDTIYFRVVALDKYLLPVVPAVDISVLDSGGSPVREWANAPLDTGILSEEFLLADQPSLGEWTIQVEVQSQKYSRQVLVADYVMPKFNMDMQVPKEVLFSEGRFNINITANHFNGLPVQGELTISAYAVFFSGLLQPVFSSPARRVVEFNGNAVIPYDLKTDLDLAEDAARPLVIEAVLEEKLTLIKQNVSTRILLLRTPYRLKVTAPDYFKPTLPYNVQIELVDPHGQLIDSSGDVTVERQWDDGAPVNVTTVALQKGQATYTLTPSAANSEFTLNLVIKYKEVTERVVNVQRCADTGKQYLTVELLSRGVRAGDDIRVRISATEPMDLLHYAVIGRGDILAAQTLSFGSGRRSVEVSVGSASGLSGSQLAPGFVLLAWYPRLDLAAPALLAAALYVPQPHLLQHQVSVSVSGAGSRAGSAVQLGVAGAAGAHGALSALDSVAALAGLADSDGLGSGLSMQAVEREVESFSGLKHSTFKNEDHLPYMGLDLGGNTTADVFSNAGMVILTDHIVMNSKGGGDPPHHEPPETGTRPPLAGPYAFSRLPPPPSPRYYLTTTPNPTWMFANFTLGPNGKGVENRRSPSTPAEWTVGAFAVHPTLGLGLAPPQKFTTSVALTMTAELPATMQRGETIAAVMTLKSTLTVDTAVDVTFHNSEQHFEFEPLDNNIDSTKKIELFKRHRVIVPARGIASTAFLVTVVRNGEVTIIVEAVGNGVSASLIRAIDVKDGYEESLWSLTLLDARRGVARGNMSLAAAAPAGTRVRGAAMRAAADVLAPALSAARAPPPPAADPPHAIRPLAIATVILDYLQATGRIVEEVALTQEARVQAAKGYQRVMAYRRSDGSFAPELDSEVEGDVWTTAVCSYWLSRGVRHVPVGRDAARGAARWLARTQLSHGAWPAPVPRRANNPRAQQPVPLAALAVMALLKAQGSEQLYRNEVNKGIDFLARSLNPELDAYSLAILAAALSTVKHPEVSNALLMLDKYVNYTDSAVYWSRKLQDSEWRNPWLRGNSEAAATAAWGLRALLAAQLADSAVSVARYLLLAFTPSDLDPDVLESLAQFSQSIKTSTKLRVSVNVTGFEEPRQFNIDDSNSLIVQTQLVRNAQSAIAVTEGRGIAVVGLSATGSTNVTAAWPRYTLDPRVDQVSTKDRLQLSICIGFVAIGNDTESGLTMLTVQLPTGYLADINTLTELTSARHVVSAHLLGGGARVAAWLRAAREERCATLAAPRALPVANSRPGYATLQDIYDSSHRARVFFSPVPATPCDVCRVWPSCERACGASAGQLGPAPAPGPAPTPPSGNKDAANTYHLATSVTLLACLVFLFR